MSTEVKTVPDTAPLWDGFKARQLRLPWCLDCERAHLPPGPLCPFCLGERVEWRPASGDGKLVTWVVERRRWFAEFDPPYAVGHVELKEGPRLVVSLEMSDLNAFRGGVPGKVEFWDAPNGMTLPLFRPGSP